MRRYQVWRTSRVGGPRERMHRAANPGVKTCGRLEMGGASCHPWNLCITCGHCCRCCRISLHIPKHHTPTHHLHTHTALPYRKESVMPKIDIWLQWLSEGVEGGLGREPRREGAGQLRVRQKSYCGGGGGGWEGVLGCGVRAVSISSQPHGVAVRMCVCVCVCVCVFVCVCVCVHIHIR
jgi:hypothetical protein